MDPKPSPASPLLRQSKIGRVLGRLGAYGDLSNRLLAWGVRNCPPYLEPLFVAGYALLFFLFCGGARRAVAANLGTVVPGSSRAANVFRAFRVFWNFAWTCVDTARAQVEGDCSDWEIVGMDHFETLAGLEGGAVLLTAHMGNYDIAAPLFAGRFRRKVHAVRAPERNPELHAIRQREFEASESDAFAVRFNTGDNFLAVDLIRALVDGEVVAIQGDRVLFDVAPLPARMLGSAVRFPKGPFVLALAGGAPIFPVFIIRAGFRSYQVRVEPPFSCARGQADKAHTLARAAATWGEVLGRIVRHHWHQWFVFEPVFSEASPEDPNP